MALTGTIATGTLCFLALLSSRQEPVQIFEKAWGCYFEAEREYALEATEGGFVREDRFVSSAAVEEVRRTLLACRREPADLLARVGITPRTLAANRARILRMVVPQDWEEERGSPETFPPALDHLLSFDRLEPFMLAELKGRNWSSTNGFHVRVTLPGDPRIVAESRGEVPWMLPWTVEAGSESWTVADPAIPSALLRLVDPDGPCARHMDGSTYWPAGFWEEPVFWDRFVGALVDKALSEETYVALDGYEEFAARFEIDDVRTGSINMQPHAMYFNVSARYPSVIDDVRWWNLIEDGECTSDWYDFLHVYDEANAAAARQGWLLDWKSAPPGRTIGLDAVGRVGTSETALEFFVAPIWEDAGFPGAPEFELLLRRQGKWCGTVFLGSEAAGAVIATARPGTATHWFDLLDFSFHPAADVPTYARVDGEGRHEIRTLRGGK